MTDADRSRPDDPPAIGGAILFFYYDDLDSAVRWYQDVLGLETLLLEDWLALLRVRPGCTIGLVDATNGNHRPLRGANPTAMLSIETDALEAWHLRFKQLGQCPPDMPQSTGCKGRTEEFVVRDPGGYSVEFFRWLQPLS